MKRKGQVALILCMTVCALLLLAAPVFAQPSDIQGHWAEQTISKWVDSGYISGYPDGTFKPDNSITRAEFMVLVNKSFKFTVEAGINYNDVSPSDWFYGDIARARAAGYITGFPDGTMRPDSPISREQAATIIMYINNLEANTGAANGFTDAAAMIWSKGAIGAVAEADIMNGYPDGSFGPQKLITRAEAVVSLDRAINYEPGPGPVPGSVTPPAPDVNRDDVSNTVSGMTTAMEYNFDSGSWAAYVASVFNDLNFSGNHTLMVRYAAEGINPYGPATTLTFTTNVVSSGGGGATALKVNEAIITVNDIDYDAVITSGNTGEISFATLATTAVLSEGRIKGSKDCTLDLTVPENEFTDRSLSTTQDLEAGWNTLDVFDYLSAFLSPDGGFTLAKKRDVFGGGSVVTFDGTLIAGSEVVDISLEVTLP